MEGGRYRFLKLYFTRSGTAIGIHVSRDIKEHRR